MAVGAAAARHCLDRCGASPSDVGMILFATRSAESRFPSPGSEAARLLCSRRRSGRLRCVFEPGRSVVFAGFGAGFHWGAVVASGVA